MKPVGNKNYLSITQGISILPKLLCIVLLFIAGLLPAAFGVEKKQQQPIQLDFSQEYINYVHEQLVQHQIPSSKEWVREFFGHNKEFLMQPSLTEIEIREQYTAWRRKAEHAYLLVLARWYASQGCQQYINEEILSDYVEHWLLQASHPFTSNEMLKVMAQMTSNEVLNQQLTIQKQQVGQHDVGHDSDRRTFPKNLEQKFKYAYHLALIKYYASQGSRQHINKDDLIGYVQQWLVQADLGLTPQQLNATATKAVEEYIASQNF